MSLYLNHQTSMTAHFALVGTMAVMTFVATAQEAPQDASPVFPSAEGCPINFRIVEEVRTGTARAEFSRSDGAGVFAVAPGIRDLGPGWTERKIVFAVDPLDQPPETVNEAASRDSSNRRRLLAVVRAEMEKDHAVGFGYFGYGFGNLVYGQGRYDLYLTRFPNQQSIQQQWSEYAIESDQARGPDLGDKAIWLPRTASDHEHRLIVRKGLYLARLECTAKQERERLVELARITVDKISRIIKEPSDTPPTDYRDR